jgi:hypothetical protein
LEALKRPGLGGKEPSDDDYRLRFAHTLPADSDEIRRFSEPTFPSQTSVTANTDTQSAMRDNGDGLSAGARYDRPIQGL